MNKDEMKMIREKCEHFNEEVCSKINCKEGCKFYGKANCNNCIHEDVCYMLDCKNEVTEDGCDHYQPQVADDEIVIKKSEYEKLRLAQYNAQTTINENFLLALEKIEQAKQETAIEILQTILDESGIDMLGNCYRLPTRVFNKIKYKYGIELE